MLKKMDLKRKLITAFLVVTLLGALCGIEGIISTRHLNSVYSFALNQYGLPLADLDMEPWRSLLPGALSTIW